MGDIVNFCDLEQHKCGFQRYGGILRTLDGILKGFLGGNGVTSALIVAMAILLVYSFQLSICSLGDVSNSYTIDSTHHLRMNKNFKYHQFPGMRCFFQITTGCCFSVVAVVVVVTMHGSIHPLLIHNHQPIPNL